MKLYLDSHTHIITNEKDNIVSLGNAIAFWKNGQVDDCSLSFERLAGFDFNFDALDTFYNENP